MSDLAWDSKLSGQPSRIPAALQDRTQLLLLGAIVMGLVAVAFAQPLVHLADEVLPIAMTVRSRGTNFGSFGEVAPSIIPRTGLVTAAAGAFALVFHRWRFQPPRWAHSLLLTAVVVGTTVWFGWLSIPHDGYPSNARFHWVDYLTWDSDNFFYAAGRIPHMLFYDHPFVWQALDAGVVALLFFLIARRMGLSRWLSVGMSAVVATSGNLLWFATTAEDVLLNVGLILFVVYSHLRRGAVLVGISLALVILGRPSFAVMLPCFVMGEILVVARGRRSSLREVDWRFVTAASAVAAAATVLAQVLFTLLGERYLLVDGRFLDSGPLADLRPTDVDGFTISAFSGTYLSHFVWILPLPFLVAAAVSAATARRRLHHVQPVVYSAGLSLLAVLLVHESQPFSYFNMRYLSYSFPLLCVMSWALLTPRVDITEPEDRRLRTFAVCALLLAPLVIPADPIGRKHDLENRVEVELVNVRHALRDVVGDRTVFLDFGGHGTRNELAYLLRRNRADIKLLKSTAYTPGGVVISRRDDPYSSVHADLETEHLSVFVNPASAADMSG